MMPTPHHRPPVSPIVGVLIGIAAVSSASVLIRFALGEGAPSLVIAAMRLTFASLILAPLALGSYRAEYRSLTRSDWRLAVISGIFLAFHFATWISSLEYTTVASSVVLVSSSPLFVAIASWLFLREKISRAVIIGLVLAVLGGIIIGLTDTSGKMRNALLGDALALAGAVTVAGYWIIGRRLRAKLPVVPYIAIVYGTAAVTLILMVGAARLSFVGYQPTVYLWILLLALGPQLLGHSSFNWALAHLPATFVSVATLGEPVGSALLAYLIWPATEAPTLLKMVGAVLILIGIMVASKKAS